MRGSYQPAAADDERSITSSEPARTARLLQLDAWRGRTPGDAHASLSIFWLAGVSGGHGVFYQLVRFGCHVAIAVLAG